MHHSSSAQPVACGRRPNLDGNLNQSCRLHLTAGCLEGAEQEKQKASSERQQFDEDDQTNLYMAAHNLKTQNKKGLGTKSHIGISSFILSCCYIVVLVHSDGSACCVPAASHLPVSSKSCNVQNSCCKAKHLAYSWLLGLMLCC